MKWVAEAEDLSGPIVHGPGFSPPWNVPSMKKSAINARGRLKNASFKAAPQGISGLLFDKETIKTLAPQKENKAGLLF